MALFYFWFFVASGIYFPYVSLYYREIHLDGAQIGLLFSLGPLAGALLPPFWGLLSDRYHWRKRLIVGSLLLGALIAPLMPLFGSFIVLLPGFAVLAVVLSPAVPLADAATLDWLRLHAGNFGTVRLFGSVGFLLSSVLAGLFFSGRHVLWLFPLNGAAYALACLAALLIPAQQQSSGPSRGEGIRFLLRDRRLVVFLAIIVVGFTSFAAYNTFFTLYLKGLGASNGVVGLATGIATLSELPGMLLAGKAVHKFGPKPVLLVGLGACVVRWLAYAAIHDYRLAMPFQLLHGLSFGASYIAGVTFVDTITPMRLQSTGQTLFNVAFFGIGAVIGSNLFGALYDHVHGSGVFVVAAAIAVPAFICMLLFVPNVRRQREDDVG